MRAFKLTFEAVAIVSDWCDASEWTTRTHDAFLFLRETLNHHHDLLEKQMEDDTVVTAKGWRVELVSADELHQGPPPNVLIPIVAVECATCGERTLEKEGSN